MPTGLVTPPEHDDDRIQDEYDRKFAELTSQPDMQELDQQAEATAASEEPSADTSKALDSDELKAKEDPPPKKTDESKDTAESAPADAPAGLYRPAPEASSGGWRGRLKGLKGNKKAYLGIGGGLLGIVFMILSIFNMFGIFKLDHILQNIDGKTFSRVNASYDARSKAYTKAYLRLRMAELTDDVNTENPVFRARRVSTDSPLRDWYRTMRLSKFESDLAAKGIVITNVISNDSRIPQFKVLKVNDQEVLKGITPSDLRKGTVEEYINSGEYDKKIDNFFDTDALTAKDARKQINTIVKDNTHWWELFKRRHLRKDLRNTAGVNSWTFFETKRTQVKQSIAERRAKLANKIADKIFKKDGVGSKIIKCFWGTAACTTTTDPVDPENHTANSFSGDTVSTGPDNTEQLSPDGQVIETVDGNGNAIAATTSEFGAAQTADELAQATADATDQQLEEVATSAGDKIVLSTAQEQMLKVISSLVGNPITKGWSWAKKLASIRDNLPKLVLTVAAARLAQQAAVYGTYSIARDQARSGELNMGEYGDMMTTLNDVTRSDGWQQVIRPSTNTASAAALTNVNEKAYCKLSPAEQANNFKHYFCDRAQQSNIAGLVNDFNESPAGQVINPIADAVDAVKNNPIGKVVDGILTLPDTIVGKVLDPVVATAVQSSGLDSVMAKVVGSAANGLMDWAGAGPQFDPTHPGAANFLVAGSAVTAETTTRSSGGVVSTPETLGYTTKLAVDLKTEERGGQGVFERYASLNNPDSVMSNLAFATVTSQPSTDVASFFSSLSSPLTYFSKLFSGTAHAQTSTDNPAAAAQWAGIKTYDIPQQCQNLDPLDANYLNDAVGVATNDQTLGAKAQVIVDKMKLTLDMQTVRNSDAYGQLLYQTIGKAPDAEAIATAIYNCAVFDTRVMGSMGAQYGYTNDNGLSETPQGDQAVNSANANLYVIGDSLTQFMKEQGGLQEKLTAPGWNPTIDGVCGRSLSLDKNVLCGNQSGRLLSGLTLVGAQAPRQPGDANDQTAVSQTQAGIRQAGVVEIALGTNDAGDPNFESHVRSMVGKIRELKPSVLIYWTNLITTDGSADKYPPMNAVLTKLQQEGLITKVIDWATQAQAISAYKPGNIHPYKYEEMSQFIAQQIGVPAQGGGVNTSNLIKGDTTNITCGAGTDLGPTDGYDDGAKYRIRICDVQGAHVNSQVAVNIDKMFTAAKSAGLAMSGGGFRSMDGQIAVRKNNCGSSDYDIYQKPSSQCNPPAARPGYSNHQMGYAIDITCNGTIIPQFTNDNPCYLWLTQNAATYGFKNLPRSSPSFEAWHWSVDGK